VSWPSTWIDRLGRDRTPSIPGHELAGVVTALSYGTTGLSVGQRVFGLTDWTRDGALAEYVAVEARNFAIDCRPDKSEDCHPQYTGRHVFRRQEPSYET
jgi:NADPH:quinone reductase-like Zn-dependent oxidoreductase